MKLIAMLLVLPACQHAEGDRPDRGTAVGHERGECHPDKTCDPDLLCLSNLCVRPPAADCKPIAEDLASIELGNYAEPETREPVVAKYAALCEHAMVTKEEGACLDKVKDKWAAAQCVPRMFPELTSSSNQGDCGLISQRVSAAMQKQVNYAANPQMKSWFDTTIRVLKQACEEDHWPDTLKRCALSADVSQNATALQGCEKEMPPALQQRLQERMTRAMQEMTQQLQQH